MEMQNLGMVCLGSCEIANSSNLTASSPLPLQLA